MTATDLKQTVKEIIFGKDAEAVSLYFRTPHDESKFRRALNAKGVKLQAWQTEHGIAVKPLELPKFKEALAAVGLMNDAYVQSVVDTLDKSANNYLEFRHER